MLFHGYVRRCGEERQRTTSYREQPTDFGASCATEPSRPLEPVIISETISVNDRERLSILAPDRRSARPMNEQARTRAVILLSAGWTAAVVALMIMGFLLSWFRESNPVLIFWVFQSGVLTATAMFVEAMRRRLWSFVFLGGLAATLLTLFLFLYFPMGSADCEEWIQLEDRQRARAEIDQGQ